MKQFFLFLGKATSPSLQREGARVSVDFTSVAGLHVGAASKEFYNLPVTYALLSITTLSGEIHWTFCSQRTRPSEELRQSTTATLVRGFLQIAVFCDKSLLTTQSWGTLSSLNNW